MDFLDALKAAPDEQHRQKLAREHAGLVYGVNAPDLKIPQQGQQTFTFIAGEQVIQVARRQRASDQMVKAATVLRRLAGKTTDQIPDVIDSQPDKHIMSIGLIPGKSLSREQFAEMPADQQNDLASRMGSFLGEMHNALPLDGETEVPWRERVIGKIASLFEKETDPESRERLQRARNYAENYGEAPAKFVTLHYDVHLGNTIYNEHANTLGFIDFTMTKAGLAHEDLIKLREDLPNAAYDTAVSSYEKVTGTKINRMEVDTARDIFYIDFSGALAPVLQADTQASRQDAQHAVGTDASPYELGPLRSDQSLCRGVKPALRK